MSDSNTLFANSRNEFDQLIKDIRPRLHRYCARMTGSVFDADDVVQETLARAYYKLPTVEVRNMEAWLFRIAHNRAIDHLREQSGNPIEYVDEYPPTPEHSPEPVDESETRLALSMYLQLTPLQRSCVVLKDVIGHSLAEVSETLDISVGAVKAALHRGRDNLRAMAMQSTDEPKTAAPDDPRAAALLSAYVDRFNARDFDALRAMLAEDVRLDLVERLSRHGVESVSGYFANYQAVDDWHMSTGIVEGQPAILVSDPRNPDDFVYVILVDWNEGRVLRIKDYRYARWIMQDAQVRPARESS